MTQACYDAFEYETFSKNCGNCIFEPSDFFNSVSLSHSGYHVARRSVFHDKWSGTANWIGYMAVSNDDTSAKLGRRDILISWRGTATRVEWLADLMDFLQPVKTSQIPALDKEVKVESGFLFVYTGKHKICPFSVYSPREQILAEVKWILQKYGDEQVSITVTGHSLGNALIILNAYDIVESGINVKGDGGVVPVSVFSYAGPRVGNVRFKERLESLGVKVLRVVNVHDKVPEVPGVVFNEHVSALVQKIGQMSFMLPWCYTHVGVEIPLDHKESPFLKETNDFSCFHNLETYLHLLNGHHGDGLRFALMGGRDIALVNKSVDFLKESLLVPPKWFQRENAGMIRDGGGHWRMFQGPNLREHIKAMNSHITELT
ncbi:hypothetical protein V2J09_011469 [Rumex salicifolius]